MVRKELHLEEAIVNALEIEAKKQNLSLKNYLEHLITQEAQKLEVPSKEYTDIMDGLLEKYDNNEIVFSDINEVMARNGMPN